MSDELLHFILACFLVIFLAGWLKAEDKAWHSAIDKLDAEHDADLLRDELREAHQRILSLEAQIEAHDCGVVLPFDAGSRSRHPSRRPRAVVDVRDGGDAS